MGSGTIRGGLKTPVPFVDIDCCHDRGDVIRAALRCRQPLVARGSGRPANGSKSLPILSLSATRSTLWHRNVAPIRKSNDLLIQPSRQPPLQIGTVRYTRSVPTLPLPTFATGDAFASRKQKRAEMSRQPQVAQRSFGRLA